MEYKIALIPGDGIEAGNRKRGKKSTGSDM